MPEELKEGTPLTDALIADVRTYLRSNTSHGAYAAQMDAIADHARRIESALAASRQQVKELMSRLEIDVAYDGAGNVIPAPDGMPDGIACRDETIRLQRQQVEQLTRERDEAQVRARNADHGPCFRHAESLQERVRELEKDAEAMTQESRAPDYVVAPREPTEEMFRAAANRGADPKVDSRASCSAHYAGIYKAMLDAAPQTAPEVEADTKQRLRDAAIYIKRVYVAHGDVIKVPHDAMRELVEVVVTCVRDLGVQLAGKLGLACPLRLRKSFRGRLDVARIGDRLARGKSGKVFQTKIHANATHNVSRLSVRQINDDVQEPIAAGILRKVGPVAYFACRQGPTAEHAIRDARETESVAVALQIGSLYGDPPKRLPATVTKLRTAVQPSRPFVLHANLVDRCGLQPQFLAAAGGEALKLECARPFARPLQGVTLAIVYEIPDVIDRARLRVQQPQVVLDAIAIRQMHTATLPPTEER